MSYDGFGEYMAIKLDKQQKQHAEYLQSGCSLNQGTQKSRVLDGVTMWFDGLLGHGEGDSLLDMKRLCVEHGGVVIDMLTLNVTHIIATHLTDRKIELWKNRRIVDPAWIHESLKAGRLLPWQRYGLIQKSRASLFVPVLAQRASTSGTVSSASSAPRQNETNVDTGAAALDRIEQEAAQFKQSVLQSGKPHSPSKGRTSRSMEATRYGAPKLQDPNQPNRESSDFAMKNSATSAGFLTKYYESSRLSKISNWKSDLRDFVVQLQSESPKPAATKPGSLKTIMHIDMDCFFASVAIRERPELKNKPVVVCHSRGTGAEFNEAGPQDGSSNTNMSTSEIASCNYIARRHGVKNGMFLGKAQQLVSQYYQQQQQLANSEGRKVDEECHPTVSCVPYDFEKYDQVSKALYKILYEMGDALMVVSCDEAYIDVSSKVLERGVGQELILAEKIREDVFLATGCTASVGIGENMVIARVATKKAKPNGAFMISGDQVEQEFSSLSVGDLPGVGYVLKAQMDDLGIRTCKDLSLLSAAKCKEKFGDAVGLKLYQFCRGIDNRPLENKSRQTVGAEVNWGVRFQTTEEAQTFIRELSAEVCTRLDKSGVQGKHITLKLKKKLYDGEPHKFLGCGPCTDMSKSKSVEMPIANVAQMAKEALALFRDLNVAAPDVRGVGIHVSKLVNKGAASKGQTMLRFTSSDTKPASFGSVRDEEEDKSKSKSMSNLADETDFPVAKKPRVSAPSADTLFPASQIDWSILEHLPPDIQAEILALRNPSQPEPLAEKALDKVNEPEQHPRNIPNLKHELEPLNLIGRTTFSEVSALLKDWVASTHSPQLQDALQLREFLKALTLNWEGELCLNVIRQLGRAVDGSRWKRDEKEGWMKVVSVLKEDIGTYFEVTYGSRPKM
ncbi:deoxycytidyl transferase [Chytriomyces hyalinus]|nr:deoxycytidyl transferase [Chytriomyces hyalinus]